MIEADGRSPGRRGGWTGWWPRGPSRPGTGPPPDGPVLERILETATTVPDHGGLRPWRFAVVSGTGRDRFGDALVEGLLEREGPRCAGGGRGQDAREGIRRAVRRGADRLPDPTSNVPVWEQVASASCTGYAMVLAATGFGFGAVWKSAAVIGYGARCGHCST